MDLELDATMRINGVADNQKEQKMKFNLGADTNLDPIKYKGHGKMAIPGVGQEIEFDLIFLSFDEMYMKSALFGNNWLSITDEGDNAQLQQEDYIKQSQAFIKSLNKDSVVKLEDEVVEGQRVSHYRLDISTDKFLEVYKDQKNYEQMKETFKNATLKTDMWVGKKNENIIKMVVNIGGAQLYDPKQKQSLGYMDAIVTIKYSNFNQPVTVEKPEGKIYSTEELQQLLQSQLQQ